VVGLAVIIKNEYELIDGFIHDNNIQQLFDQIVFVDDFSDDGSFEKLAEYGFAVTRRYLNFNFAAQRNYAGSLLNTDYICRIDMDERLNNQAQQFIQSFIGKSDYYEISRNEIVDGKLRHVTQQPFIYKNKPEIQWIRTVHELVSGYKSKEVLPKQCRLIHSKSSERCERQNLFYHNNFIEHRRITDAKL